MEQCISFTVNNEVGSLYLIYFSFLFCFTLFILFFLIIF
uniref:Uncharacterized protein n=1 Tax=Salix viminalis TaxID=40686 RepID=A0A6N2L281_SALVM